MKDTFISTLVCEEKLYWWNKFNGSKSLNQL